MFQRPDPSQLKVTHKNRAPVFLSLGLLFVFLYLLTNHYPIRPPTTFGFSKWDLMIPFWPWTAWIYVSDYAFPLVAGFALKTTRSMTRVSFAFAFMICVATMTFAGFPTYVEREEFFPLTDVSTLLYWVRFVDTPLNSFPSLHVAIVWLSFLAVLSEGLPRVKWLLGWALLIAFSTLTTKQHTLMDVTAGFVLGWVSWWLGQFNFETRSSDKRVWARFVQRK